MSAWISLKKGDQFAGAWKVTAFPLNLVFRLIRPSCLVPLATKFIHGTSIRSARAR